jgi:hypothetical protein
MMMMKGVGHVGQAADYRSDRSVDCPMLKERPIANAQHPITTLKQPEAASRETVKGGLQKINNCPFTCP